MVHGSAFGGDPHWTGEAVVVAAHGSWCTRLLRLTSPWAAAQQSGLATESGGEELRTKLDAVSNGKALGPFLSHPNISNFGM
jgi:hypothetical protein